MADNEFNKRTNYEPFVVTTSQPTPSGLSGPQPSETTQDKVVIKKKRFNDQIVISTQPGAGGRPPQRDWNTGVWDCFSDSSICLLGCFCPCYLQFTVARDMGDPCCDACCFAICAPVPLLTLRAHLRGKENIRGSLCEDFMWIGRCGSCVLCQLAREVKLLKATRGYV